VDYAVIRERIEEVGEGFKICEIAFDRWNATQVSTELAEDGFQMVPFGQGFGSMAGPTKEVGKLIIGRQIAHGGNPVLRWMMSNVAVKQDPAGNLKPDKSKTTEKIDGVVALVMAVGRAVVHQGKEPEYQLLFI
jgi:phage terminase large subunit-like protein